ncbi:MAG: U32 family peptidase [Clostridia bacterium]|nr:U32 family peptidase [Clostridia bacterium]
MKELELLCPAGTLEGVRTAVDFGADAVYLGGSSFGMRTTAALSDDDLAAAVEYAHAHGVKIHVTCNIVPHNDEAARLPDFLTRLDALGVDALIVADFGTLRLAQKYAPHAEIHLSVQAGVTNYETARAFYELGAKRVVLARELTIEEIAEIRAKTPPDLELEAFCHGAMCVSMSGRCLLSDYMAGRDANRGACAQSCRWHYALMEEKRPGQYYDISEDDGGTYILNANDMRMAEHLDKLAAAGVTSFKIEGRAKSEYYIAVVTNAYRGALDSLIAADGQNWQLPDWVLPELDTISHRPYSNGFYFGRPNGKQTYESAGYLRDYSVAATVDDYRDGRIISTLKNKFIRGQQLNCLEPHAAPFIVSTDDLYDGDGIEIESAPHPMMQIQIPFPRPVCKGAVLRMKVGDSV